MKLLIIGKRGQLARCLAEEARAHPKLELTFVARPILDLEKPGSAASTIRSFGPDLVINAAAYTAVDEAEENRARAFRINAAAAGEISAAAAAIGAGVVHLSTDYVFDGATDRPYREGDPVGPINVYGESKLAGETAVVAANRNHLILRTSWVFSPFGQNFVRTMLRLAIDKDEVSVVADQHGCPTSAHDIAKVILRLAEQGTLPTGTFHASGAANCSWGEFARGIFDISVKHDGPMASVRYIDSAQRPTLARRPKSSVLNSGKLFQSTGFQLPSWTESLTPVVERILREGVHE